MWLREKFVAGSSEQEDTTVYSTARTLTFWEIHSLKLAGRKQKKQEQSSDKYPSFETMLLVVAKQACSSYQRKSSAYRFVSRQQVLVMQPRVVIFIATRTLPHSGLIETQPEP